MRLFVMTSRVPWPLEKGDKLRIYHQLKHLHQKHEVFLCCLTDKPLAGDYENKLREICSDFKILRLSKGKILLREVFAIFDDRPFQVHYFFNRQHRKTVYQLIDQFKPDHIYCQLVRATEYVKHIHSVPKTLDYMDAFNKGIERRIDVSPWYLKWLWKLESRRLMAYENLIYEYFENHSIISEQDQQLIVHPQRGNISIIPNGVDSEFFSPRASSKEYDIVFVGNMNYPPNVDCVQYLVKNIMPLVWASRPSTKVLIAGAEPHPSVQNLQSERVAISGWVEDIRDSYASGKIFAAPLRIGTGLQNKLLEAMSMCIPCVTTSLANNALGAKEGKEILLGGESEDFAAQLLKLLDDEVLREQLGENGRHYVKSQFSWEATTVQLEFLLGK